MKTRESGMPDEDLWSTFFTPAQVLDRLGLTLACRVIVDFGCGYGTFTLPAARRIQSAGGLVHAFDIDPAMLAATRAKAHAAGLTNIRAQQRDFVAAGTGLPDASVDYAMLFNILHDEDPLALLREAFRILTPAGRMAIMHWNYDPATPRGPSMAIRPRPDQCRAWAEQTGFRAETDTPIDLPPYHYGLTLLRPPH